MQWTEGSISQDENQKDWYLKEANDFIESEELNKLTNLIKDAVAYMNRGACYREKGDSEKARADLEKAKQLGFTPPTQK